MAKLLPRFRVPLTRCASTQPAVAASGGRRLLSFFRPRCRVQRLESRAPAFLRSFSIVADASSQVDVGSEKDGDATERSGVQSSEMTTDDFKELITSEEVRRKVHLILLEYVSCRDTVGRVPSVLSVKDMAELLDISSPIRRTKYFGYLFKTEMADLATKRRKEKRRLERLAAKEEVRKKAIEDGSINHIQYGIANTIFLFIRDQSMNNYYNYRQAEAAMFGQTLVFDLDYEHEMSKRELINAADQLQEVYATNRADRDPFNLVFCNVKDGSQYKQHLQRVMPHFGKPSCLVTATEKSYLDLYPKEKLVYLTPDARQPLYYSDDAVYIIGAMVDLGSQRPLSMARAKRQGISFARLPLDEHLPWGQSASKTLALNHITRILLDMKATKDWSMAFRSIPRRKLKTLEELKAEAQYRSTKEVKKRRVLKKFKLE